MDTDTKRECTGKVWRACIAAGLDLDKRRRVVEAFRCLIEPDATVHVSITVPGQTEPIAHWARDAHGALITDPAEIERTFADDQVIEDTSMQLRDGTRVDLTEPWPFPDRSRV